MYRSSFFLPLWLILLVVGCAENSDPVASVDNPETQTASSIQPESSDEERAEQALIELKSNFKAKLEVLKSKVAGVQTEEQKNRILNEENPESAYARELQNLAIRFPKTESGYQAALESVSVSSGDMHDSAMQLLISKYANKLDYRKVIDSLHQEIPNQRVENWLRLMIEHAPDDDSKPRAMMGLVKFMDQIAAFRVGFEKNPRLMAKLSDEQQEYLRTGIDEKKKEELVGLLNTVADQYPKGRYERGRSFGEAAEAYLYEFANLEIGMIAPDIVGQDLDGIEFKLSDYRGKVIMLDFWGHWCGPCRQMYPQEREMVEQLAKAPFVLLGMNSDHSREFAQEAVEKEGLSWRHFWNGRKGTRGPIASKWNVQEWPTIFLIDGAGVIRYKGRGDELDSTLEKLLAEVGHQVSLDL